MLVSTKGWNHHPKVCLIILLTFISIVHVVHLILEGVINGKHFARKFHKQGGWLVKVVLIFYTVYNYTNKYIFT